MFESGVKPKLYLLDVEGTTSPISLVSEQLFPYARKHLDAFLRSQHREAEMQADLALLNQENQSEVSHGAPRITDQTDMNQALAYLVWLMQNDRKSTALKSIQGRIWKHGFDAGELTGTVFPDVPEALGRWSKQARVAIYSSGSVEAQRMIFRHSSAGDLSAYLSGYFDTRVGAKTSSASYRAIAVEMRVDPAAIVFVSDILRELDAAQEAGCMTSLSLRKGNLPVPEPHGHCAIRSFAELD